MATNRACGTGDWGSVNTQWRILKKAFSLWKPYQIFPFHTTAVGIYRRNNPRAFWICVWENLGQGNHMFIVILRFQSPPVWWAFTIHPPFIFQEKSWITNVKESRFHQDLLNPLAVYHGFLLHNPSLSKQAQLRRQILILPQKRTQTNQQVKKQTSFVHNYVQFIFQPFLSIHSGACKLIRSHSK